jgi:hypothetical protein
VLLAETLEGGHYLIKLVSAGYTEVFYRKPRIDKDLLARYGKGIIGLSSCLKGEIPSALTSDQTARALTAAGGFRDILGRDNFFLELQWHGIDDQKVVNRGLAPIARDLGLSLVATNDVHYLQHGDHVPHDVLLCIGTGRTVHDQDRLRYHGDQFYLKTYDEMAAVFGTEFPDALSNTVRIAERCDVDLSGTENHLPNFAVPDGYTLDEYFEHQVRLGFAERLERLRQVAAAGSLRHGIEDYEPRLAYEIEMIKRMRYPGYFLIVWDFIRYAREQGIPVGPGRGSAAGSLVAYCLRITDVDPLHTTSSSSAFSTRARFLPDIDIDFARRRGRSSSTSPRKGGRERRPDHHVRDDEGEGGGSGRGAGAGHPVGRGQQGGQAHSRDSRHDARQGHRGDPGAEGTAGGRREGRRAARRRTASRGHGPPRVDACRRGRHRAGADHRLRAALQGWARRNRHAVGDEGDRACYLLKMDFRAEHADAHPDALPRSSAQRARRSTSTTSCSTTTRRELLAKA